MQSIKFKLVFCLKVFSLVLSECFDRRSYDDLKFVYDISTMKEKANFFAKVGSKFFVVRCNFRTVRSHHDDDDYDDDDQPKSF